MKKFNSIIHKKLIKKMPFSYVSTALYLDFCAYVLKVNEEDLVVSQDKIYKHDFPSFFLPEKSKNRRYMSASMALQPICKDIVENHLVIKHTITEFIYSTEHLLNPTKSFKQDIDKIEKKYDYKIKNKYSKKKIIEFYNLWKQQKKINDIFIQESDDFYVFCLKNLNKYKIKQIYVEINEELAGFIWAVKHSKEKWVIVHIKIDYQYKGLSEFLIYEITKLFRGTKEVSFGTDCQNKGIADFKRKFDPIKEKDYYYILTK